MTKSRKVTDRSHVEFQKPRMRTSHGRFSIIKNEEFGLKVEIPSTHHKGARSLKGRVKELDSEAMQKKGLTVDLHRRLMRF